MEPWLIVLLSILGVIILLILLLVILGSVFFKATFYRRKDDEHFAENENPEAKKEEDRVWFWKQDIKKLSQKSLDGLKLDGYLLENNTNKLAILVHGYHGRYYSSVIQARMLFEHGYSVLLINNRSHDTSEGKTFSMGPKESEDLVLWINKMTKENPKYQIALYGVSMGAHIIMLTACRNIPNNVKCVIEDCGYASLKEELKYQCNISRIPLANLFIFACRIYARLFHHFSMNSDVRCLMENLKVPMCIIHGEEDHYVPLSNVDEITSSIPSNIYYERNIFKNAGHTQSMYQKDKYREVLINFVDKYIK